MTFVASAPWLAQPAGLLVGLMLALLVYRLGRGVFSRSLFFAGVAIGATLGATLGLLLSLLDLHNNPLGFSVAERAFVFAGAPEEAIKLAGLCLLVRPHYLRRNARDLALGAASIAIGFALLENSLYFAAAGQQWQALLISRAFISAPFHVLLGIASAIALVDANGREITSPSWARIFLVWLMLSLAHGAFDFSVMAMQSTSPIATLDRISDTLHVAPRTALAALLLAATTLTGWAALRSLLRVDRADPDGGALPKAARPLWSRVLLSRPFGVVIATLLLLPVAALIALSSLVSFVADSVLPVEFSIAVFALPLVLGAMFARWPRRPREARRRASKIWRWGLGGLAAALAILLVVIVAFPTALAPVRFSLSSRYAFGAVQLSAKGDLKAAVGQLDRALALRPDESELWGARADVKAQLGRFAEAATDYNAALRLRPKDPGLLAARSENELTMGDVRAALADIDAALAVDPNNAKLWAARASRDLAAGEFSRAGEDATRAGAIDDAEPKVAFAKAGVALEQGDYKGALGALSHRYPPHVDISDIVFTAGRVQFYRGDFATAERGFGLLAPHSSNLYPTLWLALAERRQGRDSPELVARLATQPPDAWPSRVAEMLLGQASEADTLAAAENDAQRCEFHFYAGELRLAAGDKDGGRDLLFKAQQMCPFNFLEGEGARAEMRALSTPG